ncbi:MAG: MTAP family purine nucleoside phosphorylase [Hyphomicrobium sp.]|nr:MTAP family purine nucleoside phosphorylase [Hyphomicrobium sp.]
MLAIIGGTGVYSLDSLEMLETIDGDTPFGTPSGPVIRGRAGGGSPVLFLARHGAGHRLLPHEVNYRANIFALKRAGATAVLGVSAVGSLAEHIAPGDLAMPEQYIDWTRGGRAGTFFGGGVAAHVSTAYPVSAALVDAASASARAQGMSLHRGLTYACVEGPRLGTRAESHLLRQAGCHLVGMTNVPEVFLAREAQMAYATIGIVTDYDCWMDDPARHVSVDKIFELYGRSLIKARALLDHLLAQPPVTPEPMIRSALSGAMLTSMEAATPSQRAWLDVLLR